jgi:hypothetical protein
LAGVDASVVKSADPGFRGPLPVPSGSAPWLSAVPPWSIGDVFTLRSGSPAIGTGSDPTAGMTRQEADEARRYVGAGADLGAAVG